MYIFKQSMAGRKMMFFDLHYSLAHLWPTGDTSFPLLQYIDPYGNAIFNGAQMSEIRKELGQLIDKSSDQEQRDVLRRIDELAVQCEKHPHQFLRFRGD